MKSLRPIDEDWAAASVKETAKELASQLASERGFARKQKAAGRRRRAGRK